MSYFVIIKVGDNIKKDKYITIRMGKKKTIALIAHDNRKKYLIDWVKANKEVLKNHNLCGTGTTSKLIEKETGLSVKSFLSGPLGGDQQIGSRIAEGEIECMIFFWDPLESQPHDPDVKALLRIAVLRDILIASNRVSADFLISSPFFNKEYERQVLGYDNLIGSRASDLQVTKNNNKRRC